MSSHFEQTRAVNELVGNLPDGSWAPADPQLKLILREVRELTDGVNTRDLHETRDGIVDVLFTVYGLAARLGIDADQDFKDMMVSQLSKFDAHDSDAQLTAEKYESQGLVVRQKEQTHPVFDEYVQGKNVSCTVTYSAEKQTDIGGNYTIPEGKWLKSHHFKEPVYAPLEVPLEHAPVGDTGDIEHYFTGLSDRLRSDDSYAWDWVCSLASKLDDYPHLETSTNVNMGAAHYALGQLFNVDTLAQRYTDGLPMEPS